MIRSAEAVAIETPTPDELQAENERLRRRLAELEAVLQNSPSTVGYRRSYDHIDDVVFETDAEGRWIHLNNSWTELVGYEVDKSIGTAFLDYLHPDDRERNLELFAELVAGGKDSCRHEIRYLTRDGGWRSVEVHAVLIRAADGTIAGSRGTLRDIAERKQSELRLRQREEQLRLFIEHAPAAVAMLDRDLRYLAHSRRWCSDYELDETDLIGRVHYDVFPNVPERCREIHRRGLAGEVQRQEDDEYRRADGSVDRLRWEIRPWYDDQGEVGGILVFSEFVTQTMLTAEEHRLSRRSLRQLNDGLQSMLSLTDELIGCPDLDTLYRRAVELARERLGIERCGIFLLDGDVFRGTYGTDRDGRTSDEREVEIPMFDAWRPLVATDRAEQQRWLVRDSTHLVWENESLVTIGRGWLASTAIRVGDRPVGVFSNDCALSGKPFESSQQELVAVYCTLVGHILEQKRAEEERRETLERLSSLIENLHAAVLFEDAQGRMLDCNHSLATMFGIAQCTRDNCRGNRAWLSCLKQGAADPEAFEQECRQLIQEAVPVTGSELLTADGRTLDWDYIPIHRDGRHHGNLWFFRDITERKQAEEALRASEERFQQFADTVDQVVWMLQVEPLQVLFVNQAFESIIGLPVGQLYADALAWQRMIHPDDIDRIRQHHLEWLPDDSQDSFATQYRILKPDGAVRWIRDNGVKIRDEAGRVYRVCGVATDVTAEIEAGQALVETEQRLRTFVEHGDDAIFSITPAGELQYLSPNTTRILSRPASELLGRPLADYIHPDDQPQCWQALGEVTSGARPTATAEFRIQNGDGKWHWYFASIVAKRENGQTTELIGIARDITQRRHAEEELRLLAAAVEQAADAVVITDREGAFKYVNPAFERVTGYRKDEVLGQNPRILKSGAHPVEFYREMWTSLLDGRTWSGRLINKRKDGSLFTEEASFAPVRNADGEITHFVGAMRDISQELQLEGQLRQAGKMEAVGRLAGGVAHDFNNLLTAISGYSEFLIRDLPAESRSVGDVKQILKAADSASALTRQLLSFSRREMIEPRILDLNRLVQDMQKMLRRLIGEDIEVLIQLSADHARVLADPGQMEQVLLNLVVNARDAMPDGGQLTIDTRNTEVVAGSAMAQVGLEPGPYVLLRVHDTGCGMSPETLSRIYEPFFTTKGQGRGTGLGLAIVYGAVKQNQGHIECTSQLGVGTTFTVYLPQVSRASEVQLPGVAEPLPGGTETILVVEDEFAVRALSVRALDRLGYKVLAAAMPSEAMQVVEQHNGEIHLLITDVVMPGANGLELARTLQAQQPEMKVLYVSGYAEDVISRHGLLDSELPFLQKPFSLADMARRARELLDGMD